MALSRSNRESVVCMEFHRKDLKLKFKAIYGNDRNERMQLFNSEEEIPHTVELEMGNTQGHCIPYNCTSIEHNVSEKAGFLKKCEDHPEEFMKILSHMICHLFGIDTNSPPLPPGEEVLKIRKDYANAGTRTFTRSALAITLQENPEINNFLYEGGFNQMSILWLLSEFAVIKFCKGM